MRALNIQINIQKYAWILKKKLNIYLNNQFFEYLFCEINIHKRLEYSRYLWIFVIFKSVQSRVVSWRICGIIQSTWLQPLWIRDPQLLGVYPESCHQWQSQRSLPMLFEAFPRYLCAYLVLLGHKAWLRQLQNSSEGCRGVHPLESLMIFVKSMLSQVSGIHVRNLWVSTATSWKIGLSSESAGEAASRRPVLLDHCRHTKEKEGQVLHLQVQENQGHHHP